MCPAAFKQTGCLPWYGLLPDPIYIYSEVSPAALRLTAKQLWTGLGPKNILTECASDKSQCQAHSEEGKLGEGYWTVISIAWECYTLQAEDKNSKHKNILLLSARNQRNVKLVLQMLGICLNSGHFPTQLNRISPAYKRVSFVHWNWSEKSLEKDKL